MIKIGICGQFQRNHVVIVFRDMWNFNAIVRLLSVIDLNIGERNNIICNDICADRMFLASLLDNDISEAMAFAVSIAIRKAIKKSS
jgi:hypothetical protein